MRSLQRSTYLMHLNLSDTGFWSKISFGLIPTTLNGILPNLGVNGRIAASVPNSLRWIYHPVNPCSCGERPVWNVVIAAVVVEGNTVVSLPRKHFANMLSLPWCMRYSYPH